MSPALVNQTKTRMKRAGELDGKKTTPKKTTKKRAERKTGTKKSTTGRASQALTAEDLVEAKKLVDELGGIDQARKALKYLEDLG